MQTSDSEKMKRAGLLERFLDVFRCLVPESKHDSTEKILHLRRVLQPSAKRVLHPGARFLCRMQDRVSTAVANQRAVFWITNKQHATNVPPRKIRAHIEFARISRRRDDFRSSEKPQCIAKFRGSAPADPPHRVCQLFPAFEFNRLEPKQKRRESIGRDFRLADHRPGRRDDAWPVAKLSSKLLAFGLAGSQTVQQEKTNSDDCIGRDQVWPTQENDGADHDGNCRSEKGGRREWKEIR